MIEHKRKNEDDSRQLEIECDQYGIFRYQGQRWVPTDENYLCIDRTAECNVGDFMKLTVMTVLRCS